MSPGEYYDEHSDAYLREYGEIFQAALFRGGHCKVMADRGMLLPGHAVLDVGCGVGGVMLGLLREGISDLTGVTISSRQRELAKEIEQESAVEGSLNIQVSDFMEWESERKFDRIILCESFGYFAEPDKLIAKVVGLLNKGGMVYLKDLCAVGDPDLVQQAGLKELEVLWGYRNYTVWEIMGMWARFGLRRIGGDDNLWRISDCSAFVRFISGNSELSRKHRPTLGQVPVKAADFLFA